MTTAADEIRPPDVARRPVVDWLAHWGPWLSAAFMTLWVLVRLFKLDDHFLVVLMIGQTPLMAWVAVVLTIGLLMIRRFGPGLIVAVCALAMVAWVAPRAMADGDRLAGADGPRLRVASANLKIGAADPAALLNAMRARDVALLAVQEMTPAWLARADAAGLAGQFPYRIEVPGGLAEGSTLFSKYPISDTGAAPATDGWYYQMYGTVTLPGGAPLFVQSVHTPAPLSPSGVRRWRDSMVHQPRATPKGITRLLIGDFNAGLDHGRMRDLMASGYRDAGDVLGRGLHGTFGTNRARPPVVLDHALADARIGIAGYQVIPVAGSDHQMLLVDLVLPG